MRFDFDIKDFVELDIEPNKLAIIGNDFDLTWQQFAESVDLLSTFLLENKVDSNIPILLYGHKSANMLVCIYACMKLEIPYIPIDEIYPIDRILSVKNIANVQWILNTSNQELSIENTGEIQISTSGYRVLSNPVGNSIRTEKKTDPLVYIIFTSGSTGEPKGVQISTEAVQSFTRWMTTDFGFTASDVFVNTAVLSFDLSVFEVMTFAAIGGTILLNDKPTNSNPQALMDRVDKYEGTVWVSTPSFAVLFARMEKDAVMQSLRHFLFCGEVLTNNLAKSLIGNFSKAKVWNTYGPTEATVATTLVEITPEIVEQHDPLPVGVSKRESELIIEEGEIIIKGSNVSIGYLNRPDLNKEKFVTIGGVRAFKTGDHGYLENDLLFFSGRNDDLVKLHGYRIELNEINATILRMGAIQNSATIALRRGGEVKKIVSLVQLKGVIELTKEEISDFLAQHLPGYMIPSDFKFVEEIPLNQNGKADKNLLLEMFMAR
jgi:D-alanine--poly(phosphoribitol) ligase subunit 1